MPNIQLVIFDLAGTTVRDPGFVVDSLVDALADGGVRIRPEDTAPVMGLPKPEAIRILLENAGSDAPAGLVEVLNSAFELHLLQRFEDSPEFGEIDGASALFLLLHLNGVRVGIDTGFSRAVVNTLFERLQWKEPGNIDFSVAADEVPQGRPALHMARRIMDKTGVTDPASVVKVGDSPADLLEGHALGATLNVGVLSGASSREDLAAHPHTHLIGSIRELPSLLGI